MRPLLFGSGIVLALAISPILAQQASAQEDSVPSSESSAVATSPVSELAVSPELAGQTIPSERFDDSSSGFWLRGEILLCWIKKAPLGTPVLTSDLTNGASPTAGGLTNPTTVTVLGGSGVNFHWFSGGRLHVGFALPAGLAIEAGGFFLGSRTEKLHAGDDGAGNPFLFRPFVDVDAGNPNGGSIVASPGLLSGSVLVTNYSQLWGTDAVLRGNLVRTDNFQLAWLSGFRHLELFEKLDIRDSRTDLAGVGSFGGVATSPGDQLRIVDGFHTSNQFFGGQLGLSGEMRLAWFVLGGNAGLSLGNTREVVTIRGATALLPAAGGVATLPGGILALPSNSGVFIHDKFSVIPEAGVKIGYDAAPAVRLAVGYDFLYWSRVVRPGDQITAVVSPAQVPTAPSFGTGGSPFPPPAQRSTDFWVQGLNFSVTIDF